MPGNDSKDENVKHLIFKKMSPKKAIELLNKERAEWLIRESSKPGCLTISFLTENKLGDYHQRFQFIGSKWPDANGDSLEYNRIHVSHRHSNELDKVTNLINLLDKNGYDINSTGFLAPKPTEVTQNNLYSAYMAIDSVFNECETGNPTANFNPAMLKYAKDINTQIKEQYECPLSCEPLSDMKQISMDPNQPQIFYAPKTLKDWTDENSNNPMTRDYLTKDTTVTSDLFNRINNKIEKIKELKEAKQDRDHNSKNQNNDSLTDRQHQSHQLSQAHLDSQGINLNNNSSPSTPYSSNTNLTQYTIRNTTPSTPYNSLQNNPRNDFAMQINRYDMDMMLADSTAHLSTHDLKSK
jgi:hypothetical protein